MRPAAPTPRDAAQCGAGAALRSGNVASAAWGLAVKLLLLVALAIGTAACAREEPATATRAPAERAAEVSLQALPSQARQTLALIEQGGPFPYRKDGSVFANRERLLPKQPHGYYTEYTVPTPGSRDRGARRIVAGKGATGNPATSGEYYYTDDHYQSFRRIRP